MENKLPGLCPTVELGGTFANLFTFSQKKNLEFDGFDFFISKDK
jgi:hypothetical protein